MHRRSSAGQPSDAEIGEAKEGAPLGGAYGEHSTDREEPPCGARPCSQHAGGQGRELGLYRLVSAPRSLGVGAHGSLRRMCSMLLVVVLRWQAGGGRGERSPPTVFATLLVRSFPAKSNACVVAVLLPWPSSWCAALLALLHLWRRRARPLSAECCAPRSRRGTPRPTSQLDEAAANLDIFGAARGLACTPGVRPRAMSPRPGAVGRSCVTSPAAKVQSRPTSVMSRNKLNRKYLPERLGLRRLEDCRQLRRCDNTTRLRNTTHGRLRATSYAPC